MWHAQKRTSTTCKRQPGAYNRTWFWAGIVVQGLQVSRGIISNLYASNGWPLQLWSTFSQLTNQKPNNIPVPCHDVQHTPRLQVITLKQFLRCWAGNGYFGLFGAPAQAPHTSSLQPKSRDGTPTIPTDINRIKARLSRHMRVDHARGTPLDKETL